MYEGLEDLKVDTVNRKTLAKQVIERIVHLLSSGQLKAGDKLPTEMELMDILHVSRPVLREALSSLETLGVITRKPAAARISTIKSACSHFPSCLPWPLIIFRLSLKRGWR